MADGTLQLPDDFDKSNESAPERYIGNYQLIRLIGAGAMGEVHLARHRQFHHRQCAIKLIRSEVTSDDARRRFEREIVAMGGLVHPNLVYAVDAGVDDGQMYLVMEYVSGRDLQSHLDRRGTFSPGQAAEILRQICEGVAHAHKHGVVHRDIKPANVLLSDDNEVKVMDLGIASLQSDVTSRMTHGGMVMGTAPFIAPELWDDAMNASPASDVYAIGCTAYCLLTGHPPFSGDAYTSLVQVMAAHRQVDPVPLHVIREDVPVELSMLILRSLSKDCNRRFHDASEFAEHLMPFCEELVRVDDPAKTFTPDELSRFGDTERLRPANRHLESLVAESFPVAWWLLPLSLMAIGLACLGMASLSEFATPIWIRVFGQWDKLSNGPQLGVVFDAIRLLFFIPVAWYVLTRYYPSEVRRTLSVLNWAPSTVLARVLIGGFFAFLATRVLDEYWSADDLQKLLSEHAESLDVKADEVGLSTSLHWYSGYAVMKSAVLTTLTVVFPIGWFIAGDVATIRRRFGDLIVSQGETSYPGRLRENLHRYGNDLRERAGRVLVVFFVATVMLQYDYWLNTVFASSLKKGLEIDRTIGLAVVIGGTLLCVIIFMTLMYVRGFEATSRAMTVCGSVKDVDDLSTISPGWLLRTTLFRRLSGIGYLSITLILGHWLWADGPLAGATGPEKVTSQAAGSPGDFSKSAPWLPRYGKPAPGATLVAIKFRGNRQVLYSRILIEPNFAQSVGEPIEMLLVPQINSDSPASFYIMKGKVSEKLFAAFEASHPAQVDQAAAALRRSSAQGSDEPAYNMTGREAIAFASAAGEAKLPTPSQWDAAFGRFFRPSEVEACVGSDQPFPVSVQRESPWGCVDLESRGREYTRYDAHWQKLVPHNETPYSLQLRGRSQFSEAGPLQLDEWEESGLPDPLFFGTRPYDAAADDIGFRIVLDQDG